jgi:hypothetical protein
VTAPIIVRRPLLHLQPLDAAGADSGSPVDVSCDMASVSLNVDAPVTEVENFCGKFTIPDEPSVEAEFEYVINEDTYANWSALVGVRVRAELYDRNDATWYRTFETQIVLNPALYGPDTPGEPRQFSNTQAVLSAVARVAVESS